jgi:succinate-semialdehyde dehydrogenase / glutarate-semialdehyde dehydrogenase
MVVPYRSVDPNTGEVIKTYDNHSDAELATALAAAHGVYRSEWSRGPIQRRIEVLSRLADQIAERGEELARIVVREMGKRIAEARHEVALIAEIARYYAGNAAAFLAPSRLETRLGDAWVEYHPIGVVVAIEPWNYPLYQLMRVCAPNVAAGNPVLAKHASIVPRCAVAFEELVIAAGAPRGAWTNIFASGEQVANLIADDRVQGVALTGSEHAGSIVASQAAKYLKKSVMELGGADVFVVMDDANVEKAVESGVEARLRGAGQVCNGAKRFLVHEKIADCFLNKFTERMAATRIGDPMDESVGLGPLCSVSARNDIAAQVERAVKAGATLHYGGSIIDGPGAFFEPTILTGISRDNPAYFEEFFGPVAQMYVVRDDNQIVELANDSHYGLSGAIFTRDVGRAKALAARIETGSVWINTSSSTAPELPFGGIKRSGYGRELSEYGLKELVNQKMVLVSHLDTSETSL